MHNFTDWTVTVAQQSSEPAAHSKSELRPSGIEVIGPVSWGTHFCQFYATRQDLVETLVPYFRAGLSANEFCMWVTSAPLQVDQARDALRAAMPDLDDYLARGQIEILDYTEWYTLAGTFDADRVLQGWTDKLAAARLRGFEGLRLTGNTFWLEKAIWQDFKRYEEKVNEVIGSQRMIALCTYSLEKCGVREIIDVIDNHQFALIKTAGKWEIIESTEHKQMEHALREAFQAASQSEARYRSLFDGMTEGFALHEIVCDETGVPVDYRFLEVNASFERLTGLQRETVIGKLHDEVLPDDDPKWLKEFGRVALTGEPVHFENYSPVLQRYYDVYAYRPAPGQFAVIFTNVTERKRLEDEMTKLSLAVEQSPVSIVITDLHGTIEYVNTRFCDLTGFTAEESRGKNPRILQSGLTPPAVYAEMWNTIKAGKEWRGEFCNRKKNGELYWEWAQISPVINDSGEIAHFLAIKEDITLRRQVESALRDALQAASQSEERAQQLAEVAQISLQKLEMVIDSMNGLVMLFDPQGNLIRINPAGLALTGYSEQAEPASIQTLWEALETRYTDGRPVPQADTPFMHAQRGEQVINVERIVQHKDTGKQWTGLFSARPLLDNHGDIIMILITGVDITNLRAAEREYLSAQAWLDVQHKLIEQREQERLQIARDLHDGPVQDLTAATFTLRGVLMDGCTPQQAQILEEVQKSLQSQINELRSYAGVLRPPTLAQFGLASGIVSYIETFQEKHPELHIHFEHALKTKKLPEEKGIALYRIFQESLANIVKHAHATKIWVELRGTPSRVCLSVQDNGRGFACPQDWALLAKKGHLGMVGMRERAEATGGKMEIRSEPGKGTTIEVCIPVS